MHYGLGEAGGVVLHAHSLVGFVDCEIPDSVDLANLCERHHRCLTGRCAVLIHHVKLCHDIEFTRAMAALRVQFPDVLEKARAGEILRTDQLAADDATLVDDVGFRELEAAVKLVGRLVLIEDGEQGEVLLRDVMLVLGEGLVARDSDDLDVGHLLLKSLQAWHLFNAGGAPARPEVEHDDFALKTLQIDGVLAIVDGKCGGWPANLVIQGAAVTSGREGAGEKDQKACMCDLPHKVLILAVFL